ncbi:hypothetical protein EG68_10894 [Paragonimus skrjabini miyazakii]|uniref:PDZ domain-containing protein n=1 Tax=Paragonimus skrjabini miyazakii TaxID=59628 RepID=A0A8S9YMN7_9TREM|nr:hypothetical protein EG68_10894 [Paragonimus skrjabini miyazakii]
MHSYFCAIIIVQLHNDNCIRRSISKRSEEVKVSATAKATVDAFAASEGRAHSLVVELAKTDEGLGFNVIGGKEQKCAIHISRISPGGVADRHGGLKRRGQLLSVNGASVESEHRERAAELLKLARGKPLYLLLKVHTYMRVVSKLRSTLM